MNNKFKCFQSKKIEFQRGSIDQMAADNIIFENIKDLLNQMIWKDILSLSFVI